MAWRYHGHAAVDPDNPRAWATCDRCGRNDNLCRLHWQHQWAGPKLLNLRLLVCDDCLDVPAPFLRTLVLPPDPDPIFNARPEPYDIDETDYRVTTTPEIRETEDLANLRIIENDVVNFGPPFAPPFVPPPTGDFILLEDGTSFLLQEDGVSFFELEQSSPPTGDFLLLEDGTSFLVLEDGVSFFELEQFTPPTGGFLLLEDGVSFLVLEDGVSQILLEQ